jgi:hypothetical protein
MNKTVRTFEKDHRDNPGLHNLYVGYAYEALVAAQEAVDALEDMSRWPASDWAHALREKMKASCVEDAAFFEAAALLQMGLEPPRQDEMPAEREESATIPAIAITFEQYLDKNRELVLAWVREQGATGKVRTADVLP